MRSPREAVITEVRYSIEPFTGCWRAPARRCECRGVSTVRERFPRRHSTRAATGQGAAPMAAAGPFAMLRAPHALRVLQRLSMLPNMRRVPCGPLTALPELGSVRDHAAHLFCRSSYCSAPCPQTPCYLE